MLARVQLTLAAVLALVALALGGVLVFGKPGEVAPGGSSSLEIGPDGWAGAQRSADIPPVDVRLRDQDGRMTSLAAYRGRPLVLTFLYSTCVDTCPVLASTIRGALDDVGGDVPAFAVSVDPVGDTAQNARRFLLDQKLTGRMAFLLGTRAVLAPVWTAFAIRPQGEGFEHSAYVLLIDRKGKQRIAFPQDKVTPEALAHDLRKLEAEPAGG